MFIHGGDELLMQKLTQKLIETVKLPNEGQVIIRDSVLRGFGLRATPGALSFIVEARINGKNRRRTIGRVDLIGLDDARQRAMRLLAQMTDGVDPEQQHSNDGAMELTLGDALDSFLSNRRLKTNTSNGYRRNIYDAFPDWITKPITRITPSMIVVRHKELPKPNKFGTMGLSSANSAMQKLRAVINFAKNNLGIKMDNPVEILNKNRSWYRLNRKKAVIADQQLPAWWKAVASLKRSVSRDFFLVLLLTGLRRSEAQTLRWENVDFETKMLTIPAELAKNHNEHVLPLSDVLVDLLTHRKLETGDSEWVFPRKDRSLSLSHQTYSSQLIGKKIGCEFSPHAARRTFVTMASRMGIPHPVVKKLVNHIQFVDIATTYVILNPECLREPMQQITDKFMSLMDCSDPEPWWNSTRKKIPTLGEVLKKYLEEKKLRRLTRINYEKAIRVDLNDWLNRPVTKISEKMVEERRNELLQRKAGVTVHQTMCVLRAVLNFAAQNFETAGGKSVLADNPVRKMKRTPESSFHRTFIDDERLAEWFKALQTGEWVTSRDYLLFVLLSGLRMREAMRLKWSDIDLEQGVILMRADLCKNRHGYCLPLSTYLREFLLARKAASADSAYVFPGLDGRGHLSSCQRIVDRICKKTGHKFNLNDLRRTFINAAVRAGISAHLVRKLINSVSSRDSLDFIDVSNEELRIAMEAISQRLLSLMEAS